MDLSNLELGLVGEFAMRRRSQVGVIVVTLLCTAFFSSSAYAEESLEQAPNKDVVQKVEEHNRKGIEYYKAGRLPEAVQEMLEAYHLIPSDDLLYNIARIYQKMEEYALALKYFQDYVTSPGVKPANVKKALEKMAEVRKAQKDNQRQEFMPAFPPPQVPTRVTPAPEPQAPLSTETTDISEAAPVEREAIPRSWIVGGVGGALVVVGAGFGLAASSAFGDFEDANSDAKKLDAQSRTEQWSTLADVSYVLGFGTIVGAVVWKYFIDEKEPVAVQVSPTVFKEGFGMQVSMPLPQ